MEWWWGFLTCPPDRFRSPIFGEVGGLPNIMEERPQVPECGQCPCPRTRPRYLIAATATVPHHHLPLSPSLIPPPPCLFVSRYPQTLALRTHSSALVALATELLVNHLHRSSSAGIMYIFVSLLCCFSFGPKSFLRKKISGQTSIFFLLRIFLKNLKWVLLARPQNRTEPKWVPPDSRE